VNFARCQGTNGAVFSAQRVSDVRDEAPLTCNINPARDRAIVERAAGVHWLTIAPSVLA
jgi:hypothetical protein